LSTARVSPKWRETEERVKVAVIKIHPNDSI
jgi:hypothetical protein